MAAEYWRKRAARLWERAEQQGNCLRKQWSQAAAAAAERMEALVEVDQLAREAGYRLAKKAKSDPRPLTYSYHTWKMCGIPRQERHQRSAMVNSETGYWEASEAIGPLRTRMNIKFEGRTSRVVGSRPQKFVNPVSMAWHHAQEYFPEDSAAYADPEMIMALGAWDTNMSELDDFGFDGPASIGEGGWKSIFRALDRVEALRLPRLPHIPTPRTFEATALRPSAHPGYFGASLGTNRSQAARMLSPVLKDWIELVASEPHLDLSPLTVGGRERRNKKPRDEQLRSRVVLGVDTFPAIIAGHFAQEATRAIAATGGEFRLGVNMETASYKKYVRAVGKSHYSRSIDISRSDQTLNEYLLLGGMAIVRSMFEDTEEIDNYFDFILSGFLMKRVITPGGYVYRIGPHTLPTGHPFTALLTTAGHWLAQQDVHRILGIPPDAWCQEQSGDDVRLHYADPHHMPEVDLYARTLKKRWGLTVKPDSVCDGSLTHTDINFCPELLAYRWPKGFPCKDRHRLWDISIMPRWPRPFQVGQLLRVNEMHQNSLADSETWDYHWAYFQYLKDQGVPADWRYQGWTQEGGRLEVVKRLMADGAALHMAREADPLRPIIPPWDRGKRKVSELYDGSRRKRRFERGLDGIGTRRRDAAVFRHLRRILLPVALANDGVTYTREVYTSALETV
jgi:hypothetical protein